MPRPLALLVAFALAPTALAQTAPAPITFLDLADQPERRVIVDREPGQYLGHPTTVLLEDGKTMLIVYPKGHGKGPIVLKRSEDGGLTWSDRLPVPENWATSLETPTIHRVVDPSGKKRLILFSGLTPIRMAASEDDGETWTPLAPIGEYGGIVAMASVERLKDGSYMALFHGDGTKPKDIAALNAPKRFRVWKVLSKDGGRTWGEPILVVDDPKLHHCEPGLVRSPDGRQIAVLLRENSRKKNSHVIFSDDEGETWTKPRELPLSLTGDRHVAKYAPDGRLFLSFRDTAKGSPTAGDWVAWVGTYDDLVHGRDGQYKVRLMDNKHGWDCAYPGVEVLPDGTIATTTYGHWDEKEKPYIVSVRLKLDELDAMAKADEPPVTREAVCRRAALPPNLDGKLDDPCWKDAVPIADFAAFWAGEPRSGTKAMLAWDDEALYYAGDMDDADLRAFGETRNDHLWEGDVFELFLKPSDAPAYYEFQANPRAVVFEVAFPKRAPLGHPFRDEPILGNRAVVDLRGTLDKTGDVDEGWTVEGRIPWTAFAATGGRPTIGDSWRFAFCRYDYRTDDAKPVTMSSAPLSKFSFHRYEDYGVLHFEGPKTP